MGAFMAATEPSEARDRLRENQGGDRAMSNARRHIVVLDPSSIAGAIYLLGNNDGIQTVGDRKCPVLFCKSVDTHNPGGIDAIRVGRKEAPITQSLFLPHGSVALIFDFLPDKEPFGFVATKS